MIFTPPSEVRRRTESFAAQLQRRSGIQIEVIKGNSLIGGGTAPNATLPTYLLTITSNHHSPEELQTSLRSQSPPVITRIENDRLMLDMRTVFPEEEADVARAIENALQGRS